MRILILIGLSMILIGCGMDHYPEDIDHQGVFDPKTVGGQEHQEFEEILEKMIAMCTGPGAVIGDQHNGTNQTPVSKDTGIRIGPGSQSAPQIPDGAYESKMQRDQWGGGGAGGHIMNTIRDHSSYSGPWADKDLPGILELEWC